MTSKKRRNNLFDLRNALDVTMCSEKQTKFAANANLCLINFPRWGAKSVNHVESRGKLVTVMKGRVGILVAGI